MRVCGVELKSNNAIFSIIETKGDEPFFLDIKTKKILIKDDESQESIREFCNDLSILLLKESIDKIVIKKRAKKGNFAGGAVTFKMEGLIQLNPHCGVQLISSSYINKFIKQNDIKLPENLMKYQENSYLCALSNLDENTI